MNTNALHEARLLAARHAHLLSAERASLADLLRSLVDFEDREFHRALGHASMFDYLHRTLRLSKGMAHYRLVACRLLRRFPEIEEPIRDGRLCTTTLIEVARVLKEENREVLPRFFGLSRQEAQQVAAEIAPALVVPRRTVVSAVTSAVPSAVTSAVTSAEAMKLVPAGGRLGSTIEPVGPGSTTLLDLAVRTGSTIEPAGGDRVGSTIEPEGPRVGSTIEPAPPRLVVVPLTARESRLHITVSPKFLELLEKAKAGESHRNPGASDEQVLVAALEALLEKQEKRKASVPAKVKREVMKRDQARCQWPTADGGICGATTNLQIDHVHPRGKGGSSTTANCRVLCRAHNLEAARHSYGDDHMDRFAPRHPVAREEIAEYLAAVAREEAGGYTTSVTREESGEYDVVAREAIAGYGPARGLDAFAPAVARRSARAPTPRKPERPSLPATVFQLPGRSSWPSWPAAPEARAAGPG